MVGYGFLNDYIDRVLVAAVSILERISNGLSGQEVIRCVVFREGKGRSGSDRSGFAGSHRRAKTGAVIDGRTVRDGFHAMRRRCRKGEGKSYRLLRAAGGYLSIWHRIAAVGCIARPAGVLRRVGAGIGGDKFHNGYAGGVLVADVAEGERINYVIPRLYIHIAVALREFKDRRCMKRDLKQVAAAFCKRCITGDLRLVGDFRDPSRKCVVHRYAEDEGDRFTGGQVG